MANYNATGRPPSKNPRGNALHIRLSDADAARLTEAAELTGKTKTAVIVEGIDLVYSRAVIEERKRKKAAQGGRDE